MMILGIDKVYIYMVYSQFYRDCIVADSPKSA